jgi:hypothetical protein
LTQETVDPADLGDGLVGERIAASEEFAHPHQQLHFGIAGEALANWRRIRALHRRTSMSRLRLRKMSIAGK